MKKIVISDVHGNFDALKECLISANVINKDGKRLTDGENRSYVVQIGDLANCVQGDIHGDLKCLQTVGDWIDVMLMGNHEHPYFGGPTFNGWYYEQRVYETLYELEQKGLIVPAVTIGPYLITHAGWGKHLHPFIANPQDAARELKETVKNHGWNHRYFSSIGYSRGGRDRNGGILWEDFRELNSAFPQIVGHTAFPGAVKVKENAICIDTGGGKYGKPTAIEIN